MQDGVEILIRNPQSLEPHGEERVDLRDLKGRNVSLFSGARLELVPDGFKRSARHQPVARCIELPLAGELPDFQARNLDYLFARITPVSGHLDALDWPPIGLRLRRGLLLGRRGLLRRGPLGSGLRKPQPRHYEEYQSEPHHLYGRRRRRSSGLPPRRPSSRPR